VYSNIEDIDRYESYVKDISGCIFTWTVRAIQQIAFQQCIRIRLDKKKIHCIYEHDIL
jgi:hypothetical protein